MTYNEISWPKALVRGFFRRCPQCGEGHLFQGYLRPEEKCFVCQLNFESLNADDGPAYITMGLVCLFIVPLFFIIQALYQPSMGMALLVSLPLTLVVILGLLPLIKGAFMGALWKSRGEN
ncbi:MAG: DUF983 domain-containing protein [Alphaproteobacteria bacterium]|nr:DUF983 domain-containing protein [Alphaproteobacteria bacterium]